MKKIKLLVLLFALSFALIACGTKTDETKDETTDETVEETTGETSGETTEETPEETNGESGEITIETLKDLTKDFTNIETAGFYLNKEGKVVAKSDVKDQKIVELYTEPRCPGCIDLETEVKKSFSEIMGENTLLKFNPVTFIGKDPNNAEFVTYSDNLSATILSIAEHDPDLVKDYIGKTMDHLYATLHFDKSEAEHINAFKETYEELGGEKWDEIEKDLPLMRQVSNMNTALLTVNEEMKNRVPGGSLSTPLVWEVGAPQTTPINTTDPESIIESMKEVLK